MGGDLLIIEDDPDDLDVMLEAARKAIPTASPRTARDGEEALDQLSRGPLPRLVTLDLNLPRIGGMEVLQRMRGAERTRRIPVVVVSASAAEGDIERAYAAGANSYVVKPTDYVEYERVTADIVRYWLGINWASRSEGAKRRTGA